MKLHRGQLNALKSLVSTIRITKGALPTLASVEAFCEFEEQIIKAPPWKGMIGETDFGMIVWRTIYRTVNSVPENYEGMLSELKNGLFSDEIVDKLKARLESLPGKYDIFIPMGSIQELHCGEIAITETIAIIDTLHNAEANRLTSHRTSTLYRTLETSPENSTTSIRYLRISGSGYGDSSPQSPVVRHAWSIAKQLIFIGMASAAFAPNTNQHWFRSEVSLLNKFPTLVVSRGGIEEIFTTSPGFEFSHLLHNISFRHFKFRDFSKGPTILSSEERDATTGAEIQLAVTSLMATAAAFLKVESLDAAPIRAAMEWFIDADAAQNETIAFLQRCIGLEALLGSNESKRDVTERLADRYSYVVANTASNRNTHRAKFVEMYKYRSEIVHGRSTRLSDEHRRANREAREMLLQATWREMRNILKQT